ncbi:MAG: von Willebrand factor type A domain-containing protein [Planctomycetes bacterium]|nr:von Willebrand factor type A domain-containing protein [Planctomycetota bacterium]
MSGKIDQELHEKLCAYVLGELDDAGRAQVQDELARSPELRAEQARIVGTIGVLRDALAPTEALSGGAREALERAARPAPIARFPWLRLAAGIGAVGLGWWIFARAPAGREDASVAQRDLANGVGPESRAERSERELTELERHSADRDQLAKSEHALAFERLKGLAYADDVGNQGPRVQEASGRPALGIEPGTVSTPMPTVSVPAAAGEVQSVLTHSEPAPATMFVATAEAPASLPALSVGAAGATSPQPGAELARRARESAQAGSATVGKSKFGTDAAGAPGGRASKRLSDDARRSADPSKPAGAVKSAVRHEEEGLDRLGHVGEGRGNDDFFSDLGIPESRRWRDLTPEEQARHLDLRCRTIVRDCLPRPNERPRDMFYRFWGDNPFEVTLLDRLSTFSVDVDTASYTLARRYLVEGKVPEKAQIRTEEFVNYFSADVAAPRQATFAVHTDLTPSRFSADAARRMLRVVVRAKDVDKHERDPLRLTFVVDVSGSMKEQNRLETVKHALRMLVAQLEPRDAIAIVKFSNDAALVLPMTPVLDRAAIEAAIAPLAPGGSTNSNAGLQLGYAQALQGLEREAVNRVVFLSDGVANVGETDARRITDGVKGLREQGIFLNTIGVGMNNHNDALLEQLANLGDGVCNYVDGPQEIQRALVDRFTGAFQPVAKDVKIQVEFDPTQVMRYRLLGYENRAIADADFRNDAVDAGEIGAGHQVTALYEIEPTGAAGDGPLATVRLRWKPVRPAGDSGIQAASEASFQVHARSYQAYESAPIGHRRALLVAQFAEILRRSIHARGDSLDDLIREATVLQAQIPRDTEFAEFVTLVVRAKELVLRTLPVCDELCQTIDALRTNTYLGAMFGEAGRAPATLAEIERTRQDLEQRLREILRKQAENGQPLQDGGYGVEPK